MAKKDNKQNEELMDETINMEETATDNTAEQQTEAEEANANNEVQQIKDKIRRLKTTEIRRHASFCF